MDCVDKQKPRERWAGASLRCSRSIGRSGKGYRLGIVVGLMANKVAKLSEVPSNEKPGSGHANRASLSLWGCLLDRL